MSSKLSRATRPAKRFTGSFCDALGFDYAAQHRWHLALHEAHLRQGAPACLHLKVGVSREWVLEGGTGEAIRSRQKQLLSSAVAWRSLVGRRVIAARLDLDGEGCGTAHVYVAPLAVERHRSGSTRVAVSLNKVLEDLSVKVTGSKGQHYRSLNTSWASAAQELLDRRLQRGRLREASGEQHVRPAVLRTLLSREQRALRVMLDAVKTGTLLRAEGALSSHVAAAVEGAEAWAALRDTVLGLAAAAGQRDKAAA
ncbi:hypothetical protein ACN9JG_21170 (plasmid) [Cereibacter azotoformans]|uniref:hypothetical protein n=1 Tax=Cereibacter azotoformans TaxID=43057 RepID=UPI003B216F21